MRIAMIGSRGVPARHGGIERAVEELGAELVLRGHEVTVFCRREDYSERMSTYRGMQLRWLPAGRGRGLQTVIHSALSTLSAVRRGFDVLHFHALGPALLAPVARLDSNSAIVATIHGQDDKRAKWGLLGQLTLRLGAWTSARVPDEVIVVSLALGRYYHIRWSRRVFVITNGVRRHLVTNGPAVCQELGIQPGRFVLHVGRLVPEKRVDLLLEAYQSVTTDYPLVIVGSQSESPQFTARVAALASADARVHLVAGASPDTVQSLYSQASMFVLPSALEGLPIVLLEAASHGCPILASDIDPHLEVLKVDGPGSRLFASGNAPALARALGAMLDDLSAERTGARAVQERVLAEHDWRVIAERTERVYEDAIAARKRRGLFGLSGSRDRAARGTLSNEGR